MQVGDLVKYTYEVYGRENVQIGFVTSVSDNTIWWVDTSGYQSWTHRLNLEVISEAR